jgi:uncharacterized protein
MEKQSKNKLVRSRVLRILFLIVGFLSLGLGTLGIFIPILPTVPFYLLTAFCFVRGSERFANWFLNSKLYINHMGNFANHRVMTIYGELILLTLVSSMLLITVWFTNKLTVTIILDTLILCKYAYFVFRITPIGRKEYLRIKEEDRKLKEAKTVND